jgi:hypothetical protein
VTAPQPKTSLRVSISCTTRATYYYFNQLNYVGKITNFEDIEIKPVYFEKGKTKVAIYFLGYIREVKLSTLLATNKIKFKKVDDSYFKILCVNQKREQVTASLTQDKRRDSFPKLEIHPQDFPDLFNLILWGGEAEPFEGVNGLQGCQVLSPGNAAIHEFDKHDVGLSDCAGKTKVSVSAVHQPVSRLAVSETP